MISHLVLAIGNHLAMSENVLSSCAVVKNLIGL